MYDKLSRILVLNHVRKSAKDLPENHLIHMQYVLYVTLYEYYSVVRCLCVVSGGMYTRSTLKCDEKMHAQRILYSFNAILCIVHCLHLLQNTESSNSKIFFQAKMSKQKIQSYGNECRLEFTYSVTMAAISLLSLSTANGI